LRKNKITPEFKKEENARVYLHKLHAMVRWLQVSGCVLVGVGVWQHAQRDRLWYGALLTIAAGPTSDETSTTGQSLTTSHFLTTGESLTIGRSLTTGHFLTTGESLTIGRSLTTGHFLTTGESLTIGRSLTTGQSLDRVTTLLVGVGTLLIVVSFLGCCGACVDSVCFLGFVSHDS